MEQDFQEHLTMRVKMVVSFSNFLGVMVFVTNNIVVPDKIVIGNLKIEGIVMQNTQI